MTHLFKNKLAGLTLISALTAATLLSACGSDKSSSIEPIMPPTLITDRYQVSVTNLTHAQPLSLVAVILHNEGALFELDSSASLALEHLAESGDNSQVLAEAMVLAGASGNGVIMPGLSETITVSSVDTMPMMLSVATMLVNTNDGFSGI